MQIKTFGESHPFTKLVVDLKDVDPDVAYSSIPYEKGFALLFHLEQLLGGPGKWPPWSGGWFSFVCLFGACFCLWEGDMKSRDEL